MRESIKEYNRRLLPRLKGKAENKFGIAAFDVETKHTRKDFRRKNDNLVISYQQDFIQGSVIDNEEKVKVFWDRDEMCRYLLSRKFRDHYIVATNLEFDFNMLYYDRMSDFQKPIHRNFLLGVNYMKEIGNKKRWWRFIDTQNYLKTSVAELGKIVGVKKLPMPSTMKVSPHGIGIVAREPRNKEEEDELVRYNINDSLITHKFANHFRNFCTHHNIRMKMTIGSVGMDFWRRNYQKKTMKRENDDICRMHFDGAFRGGMTQVLKRGTYEGDIYHYDYRSFYPSMLYKGIDGHGTYPDPSTSKFTEKGTLNHIDKYEGICHAKIDAPYHYFPYLAYRNKENKLLFPYGTFEGWFCNFELRKAIDLGYQVEPGEMIFYENTFVPFRECVSYLYELRKKYKEQNHPYQAMVKTLMNSGLFGKWGTNFLNMEDIIWLDKVKFGEDGYAYFEGERLDDYRINEFRSITDGFLTVKKEGEPFRYTFPILSTYTTMLGRTKLWDDLQAKSKYLMYSDTDSAWLSKDVLDEGYALGDWELEGKAKKVIFIKPKFYRVFGKKSYVKCKGVGKFVNMGNFNDVIDRQSVFMERFTKMKESNRMKMRSGSIIFFTKNLNFEDNKRNWINRFKVDEWQDSDPLKLSDGLSQYEIDKDMRRAKISFEKEQEKRLYDDLKSSDFFDSKGDDITDEEYYQNEMYFELNE